jgi:hypothetical protein
MSQYDLTKGYSYDLFDDTMSTVSITSGAGGGGGIYTTVAGLGTSGTYSIGSIGTAGQTLTWNGTDTVWADNTYIRTPLHVNGDAEIDGDLKVKGKSLAEAIENIEKRLAILHPNPELEERWEQLKALGEQYRELEKDILEKEKIWDILKK